MATIIVSAHISVTSCEECVSTSIYVRFVILCPYNKLSHTHTMHLYHLLHLHRAEQMGEQERGFPRPLLHTIQTQPIIVQPASTLPEPP